MSHTLMAVLGSVLVDERLRKSLLGTRERVERLSILKQRGFFLSKGERKVFECMMKSFESGALNDLCLRLEAECPDWPCTHFSFD